MTIKSSKRQTIVFDLDDTLYDECDYVDSGKRAVAKLLSDLYGIDVATDLLECETDFLQLACTLAKLPVEAKTSLLWAYRNHLPTISLRDGVIEAWQLIRIQGDSICVLTDGREITQRLKLTALNVVAHGVYISETVGAEKPSLLGFQQIEADFPAAKYFYVADNVCKDFIAPRQLGWFTIGVRPRAKAIHGASQQTDRIVCEPHAWIEHFEELQHYIARSAMPL